MLHRLLLEAWDFTGCCQLLHARVLSICAYCRAKAYIPAGMELLLQLQIVRPLLLHDRTAPQQLRAAEGQGRVMSLAYSATCIGQKSALVACHSHLLAAEVHT